jgi:ribosomal protein S18 acetylase RimI-like enzyme
MDKSFVVRRATPADLPAIGDLGGLLMQVHHQFDAQRFMAPGHDPARGYSAFLGGELDDDSVAVFIAEQRGHVLGYVYAGIEPQSWKELREEAGFIHDVAVVERGRRSGVATALIEAALDWFRERKMPRVVLWAAEPNRDAQRLFGRLGFRRTMVEMTREL